ncbi:MAG: thiamine pyrophosphate-dependent enzyme [Candidatus Bathyarchaeia archaeon]
MKEHPNIKFLRKGVLPHGFCPGCGCGQILNYFLYAVDELKLDVDNMALVTGVGCSARIPVYIDAYVIHGVHGRTFPISTGIKLANPNVNVVVFTGDGDCAAIGANHFIQAARRNLDVTVILVNNGIYGMTGGQVAPTTPSAVRTSTTPYGNIERIFDLCKLAETAGATYVCRWTTAHSRSLINAIKKGLEHKGFALIEIVSQCPTYFGRYALGFTEPERHLNWLRENSVTKEKASKMSPEELRGKIVVGEFVEKREPTLIEKYLEVERKISGGKVGAC